MWFQKFNVCSKVFTNEKCYSSEKSIVGPKKGFRCVFFTMFLYFWNLGLSTLVQSGQSFEVYFFKLCTIFFITFPKVINKNSLA